MPNKGIHKGFNKDIPGGSSGTQDILARIRTGQSLADVEPRPVSQPKPPMTPYEESRWCRTVSIELIHAREDPLKITPTPQFAIAQLVRFIGFLTMVTGRRLSPIRNGWEYFTEEGARDVPVVEACLHPVAQEVPFDELGDWIPSTFVLERKPDDHKLPLAV